jgi:hypothetical protein
MGHESQIEPWVAIFRSACEAQIGLASSRRAMKTAGKETEIAGLRGWRCAARNTSSITWGWKQEKLRPSEEKCFLLTSPSIELLRLF